MGARSHFALSLLCTNSQALAVGNAEAGMYLTASERRVFCSPKVGRVFGKPISETRNPSFIVPCHNQQCFVYYLSRQPSLTRPLERRTVERAVKMKSCPGSNADISGEQIEGAARKALCDQNSDLPTAGIKFLDVLSEFTSISALRSFWRYVEGSECRCKDQPISHVSDLSTALSGGSYSLEPCIQS